MRSSYRKGDVTLLLKDITGQVEPMATARREALIQQGVHYSEMLPLERLPSAAYLESYHQALGLYAPVTARAVAAVAQKLRQAHGGQLVLVSLARAGISVGVLIKRYLEARYGQPVPHYAISIIRGRGIDRNAMDYILARHTPGSVQFVDGWTGKGAIAQQLQEAMADYPGVSAGLAVLSDPASVAQAYGTRDDFLIPSAILNSTVSGLMSRTLYRSDLIGRDDFHGAAYLEAFEAEDLTYGFIDAVEAHFAAEAPMEGAPEPPSSGIEEAQAIARAFGIGDINLVKPSIGEATRVLLRRVPWKVLVHSLDDREHLGHLYRLAEEKDVELVVYPLRCYRACGLIRRLADS